MCHDTFWGVATKIPKTRICAMTHLRRHQRQYQDIKKGDISVCTTISAVTHSEVWLRRYQRQYQDIKDGDIKDNNMYHDSFWRWLRRYRVAKSYRIFHKRATKFRSLLRKVTYRDKGCYESWPLCIKDGDMNDNISAMTPSDGGYGEIKEGDIRDGEIKDGDMKDSRQSRHHNLFRTHALPHVCHDVCHT